MPRNDLEASERRWRKKPLFKSHDPAHPLVRLITLLSVAIALVLLVMWTDLGAFLL